MKSSAGARLFLLTALATTACSSSSSPTAEPDTGMVTDTGRADQHDASIEDASTPGDAGRPLCSQQATLTMDSDSLIWDWWAGDELPQHQLSIQVDEPGCTVHISTTANWLIAGTDPTYNHLFVRLDPQNTPSGVHEARVELRLNAEGPIAAAVNVRLSALNRPSNNSKPRVLVIGMDGVRPDALSLAYTPQIDRLARRGTSSYSASTQLSSSTVSAAGWHSIFTGVEPTKHRVTVNGFYERLDRAYPTFFERAHRELEFKSAVTANWVPILEQLIEANILNFSASGTDQEVTDRMVETLIGGENDIHFVHLDDVDHAGHDSGFDPYNEYYIRAIEGNDTMVGSLIDAIKRRADVANENWLVIWVTDHGGSGRDHGDRILTHQRIPQIVAGPDTIRRSVSGGNHMDIHPTIMQHIGLSPQESWDLDGRIFGLPLLAETNCTDGFDDDQDGHVDCADSDCNSADACVPIEEICPGENIGQRIEWAIYTASMQGAVARLTGSCGGTGRERTVLWRAPRSGRFTFNTISSRGDTVLWARPACEGEELACNDNLYGDARMDVPYNTQSLIQLDLTEGQSLILGLDEAVRNGVDQVVLNVYELALACSEASVSNALGSAVAQGDNDAQATRFTPSCAGMGRDHVLLWTAPQSGTFRFDTQGSALDTVLAIYDADCLEELACNDDGGSGFSSTLDRTMRQGDQIAIVIGGFRGRNGPWQLNINVRP